MPRGMGGVKTGVVCRCGMRTGWAQVRGLAQGLERPATQFTAALTQLVPGRSPKRAAVPIRTPVAAGARASWEGERPREPHCPTAKPPFWLGDAENGVRPTLFVHSPCGRLVETVPSLQHDPNRPEDVLKVDADEDGVGGDDAADALRYLVATKPRVVVQRKLGGL